MLPESLVGELPEGALVVEVGVGGRWDTLAWLRGERPDLVLRATDVRADRLQRPPDGVEPWQDDVIAPDVGLYEGAALVYSVRCPEELQAPLARVASAVAARLALAVVKDELADIHRWMGPARVDHDDVGRTWRVHEPRP